MASTRSLCRPSLRRTAAAAFSTSSTPYRLALRPLNELPTPHFFISGSDNGNVLSPWHQIPLFVPSHPSHGAYMVVTTPRHTTAALRLSLTLPYNPLVQERAASGGSERFYGLRTLAAMGELPQTYEDPDAVDAATGARGNGAPLAVIDIGSAQQHTGAVVCVRVLGALAVVEGGATAWKILAVQDSDPLAASLSCITAPGAPPSVLKLAGDLAQWMQLVPVTEGGVAALLPAAASASSGASSTSSASSASSASPWLGRDAALELLQRSHKAWQRLVERSNARARGASSMYSPPAAVGGPWVPPPLA